MVLVSEVLSTAMVIKTVNREAKMKQTVMDIIQRIPMVLLRYTLNQRIIWEQPLIIVSDSSVKLCHHQHPA